MTAALTVDDNEAALALVLGFERGALTPPRLWTRWMRIQDRVATKAAAADAYATACILCGNRPFTDQTSDIDADARAVVDDFIAMRAAIPAGTTRPDVVAAALASSLHPAGPLDIGSAFGRLRTSLASSTSEAESAAVLLLARGGAAYGEQHWQQLFQELAREMPSPLDGVACALLTRQGGLAADAARRHGALLAGLPARLAGRPLIAALLAALPGATGQILTDFIALRGGMEDLRALDVPAAILAATGSTLPRYRDVTQLIDPKPRVK